MPQVFGMSMQILTIGHGSQAIESFVDLLRHHHVEVLVDTRSRPFSSRHPQFGQRVLARLLDEAGIRYLFLGDRVGGRPRDTTLYDASGKPDYDKIEHTESYRQGIDALLELAGGDETVAIMCSESDYKECHRYKLVAKSLVLREVDVKHILKNGALEDNPAPQLALFK